MASGRCKKMDEFIAASQRAVDAERAKKMDEFLAAQEAARTTAEEEKRVTAFQQTWEQQESQLRREGWRDSGIEQVRKFAEDNGISSLRIAADAYERRNPQPGPVESRPGWNLFQQPETEDTFVKDQMAAKNLIATARAGSGDPPRRWPRSGRGTDVPYQSTATTSRLVYRRRTVPLSGIGIVPPAEAIFQRTFRRDKASVRQKIGSPAMLRVPKSLLSLGQRAARGRWLKSSCHPVARTKSMVAGQFVGYGGGFNAPVVTPGIQSGQWAQAYWTVPIPLPFGESISQSTEAVIPILKARMNDAYARPRSRTSRGLLFHATTRRTRCSRTASSMRSMTARTARPTAASIATSPATRLTRVSTSTPAPARRGIPTIPRHRSASTASRCRLCCSRSPIRPAARPQPSA